MLPTGTSMPVSTVRDGSAHEVCPAAKPPDPESTTTMKDITRQFACYRDALIAMWDKSLSSTNGKILDWDMMDALDDAGCCLFTALVSIHGGMPEMKKTPSYESTKRPCDRIVVHATSFDGAFKRSDDCKYEVVANQPATDPGDLLFLDLFDWNVQQNRKFEFVEVVSTPHAIDGQVHMIIPFQNCRFYLLADNR